MFYGISYYKMWLYSRDLNIVMYFKMTNCCQHYFLFIGKFDFPGPFPLTMDKLNKMHGMDPQVIVDALALIFGNEEKDLCTPGTAAISLMLKIAVTVIGSKEKVWLAPFVYRYCHISTEITNYFHGRL